MSVSVAGSAGSLVLDAEALYAELLRGVRSLMGAILQMTAAQHWPRLLTVALSFALIMGFSGFFIGRWAAYHAADVEAAETVTQLTHIPAETLQAYVTWLRSGNNPRWLQCEGGEQGTNNGRSVCTRTFWLSPR